MYIVLLSLLLHSTKPELRFDAALNSARRMSEIRNSDRISLTMAPTGNKAKRLSSVNHPTKTINHH